MRRTLLVLLFTPEPAIGGIRPIMLLAAGHNDAVSLPLSIVTMRSQNAWAWARSWVISRTPRACCLRRASRRSSHAHFTGASSIDVGSAR